MRLNSKPDIPLIRSVKNRWLNRDLRCQKWDKMSLETCSTDLLDATEIFLIPICILLRRILEQCLIIMGYAFIKSQQGYKGVQNEGIQADNCRMFYRVDHGNKHQTKSKWYLKFSRVYYSIILEINLLFCTVNCHANMITDINYPNVRTIDISNIQKCSNREKQNSDS